MGRTDRRAVLQGMGSLAALGLGGSAGWARDRARQTGRKLGYAVVGLGYYATQQIMPQFRNCEFAKLTALVSGTPEKLARYGAEYDIPRTHRYDYQSYDRMSANPDIDIVYVVLPNAMHAEYTVRAAQAGKHVLCEKPMATSSAECRMMIAACREAGKKLMIGYRSRFEPYNRLAIDLARSGHVGPSRVITAQHGFPISPDQWRLDRDMAGGGSLMDIGIYSLNAARYLTGEEPTYISAVESTDRSDPRFREVEDRIDWEMLFPSGVLASCVSSYSSPHNAYRVTGTQGWIDLEPATQYSGQAMRVSKGGTIEPRSPVEPGKNQFVGQLDHLAECVVTEREPIVPGEEGLRDLVAIEAIYRSAREGRRVAVAAV
ncbi:Gfo/Idh/MocA family protein [Aurantiacibacter spongiae]|uniref:Gfo/Idh/MocA family oxidoreductase n=1 Tax=Aurantiacibacter spongiae TaxID=2488860 RepID=A0A3N5CTX9_9SPHN|nr:Gfo/Idh/MocA family oxidoreductase [Aurantiacibacter spongiae]RPF72157.1 gfo/Idh/MocA family oxidoreductase [Aurantiacibacter spongiae]